MLILRLILIGALSSLAFGVRAADQGGQTSPVVVELFTSQGCSACPPADAIFNRMSSDPSIIRISWHVDYWNDLGWKDTQAKPEFTDRQRAYQTSLSQRFVYTPQMVVNGRFETVGSKEQKVEAALEHGRQAGLPVSVTAMPKDGGVEVQIGEGKAPTPADVWLVSFHTKQDVAIGGGENHGRHLTYTNVACGLRKLGSWTGYAQTIMVHKADLAGKGDGYAILLQEANAGPILGATTLLRARVGE